MRIDRVYIKDFLSYEEDEFDLTDRREVVVVGPVGAGKSTLIDAITWGLFGKARMKGRDHDALIRYDQPAMKVAVLFESDGWRYRVTRTRRRGKDTDVRLERYHDEGIEDITGHTNAETQTAIDHALGVQYDHLLVGPWLLQSGTGGLLEYNPASRKALLLELLMPFARWSEWAAECSNYVDMAARAIERHNGALETLGDAEADLERAAAMLAEQEVVLAGAEATLTAAKSQHERRALDLVAAEQADAERARTMADLKEAALKVAAARENHAVAITDLADAKLAYAEYNEERQPREPEPTSDDWRALRSRRTERMAAVERAAGRVAELRARQGGQTCHACGKVTEVCAHCGTAFAVDPLQLGTAEASHAAAAAALVDIDTEERELRAVTTRWDAYRQQGEATRAVIAEAQARVDRWRPIMDEWQERTAVLDARIKELGEPTDHSALQREEQLARTERDMASAARDEAMRETGFWRSKVQVYKDAVAKKGRVAEDMADAQYNLNLYTVLAKMFGRDGVPTLMLESALPLVESEANEVLSGMPGNMALSIETQRENKGGGYRDVLDIVVTVNGQQRDYELLSGGQQFRVDLAVRLGLTRVLAQKRIGTFIADEGLDRHQDPDGRRAVLDALATIAPEFDRVIVVSHHPEVIERFGDRIEVRMDGGVSRVA